VRVTKALNAAEARSMPADYLHDHQQFADLIRIVAASAFDPWPTARCRNRRFNFAQ
jgi:hypothetical protein